MKITRKKIDHKKEAPVNLFNVSGEVTLEKAFAKFKRDENEVTVFFKGGSEIKFSDFRKFRGLTTSVYNGDATDFDEDVLWSLIFDNFELEADTEFEQSTYNLRILAISILSKSLETIASNKKK